MRAGACTVQQTLTTEAASVLKHSLSLARRRGHAQVTPLHVAFTLLSSRASILRRACLKSQPSPHHLSSHPLHCRALELCFNVALNRLPTTPGPLLHGQPSLSNALIAALKRAQAHQRRGCIEQQQQQPLLTIKVELEQLIISILDDPSVSRVMREAGFSSTAVKNNVEDSSSSSSPVVFQCYGTSGGVFSSPSSPPERDNINNNNNNINNHSSTFWPAHFLTAAANSSSEVLFSPPRKSLTEKYISCSSPSSSSSSVKEDIKLVLEVMLRKKRRNTVIVGDSMPLTEGLVVELMGRIAKGDVPEELKSAHFIKFQFAPVALRFMKREDVEMNLTDLKRKVDSLGAGGRGAIIYAGDLKWTVEAAAAAAAASSFGEKVVIGNFNPVDYLVAEIGRIVAEYCNSNNSKVWLVGTASYQTYTKCQMRTPSLEILWGLQAVSVPSGGLGLSLQSSSVHDSRMILSQKTPSQHVETKIFSGKEEKDKDKITCCAECISNYEKEAQLLRSGHQKRLPSWLQPQDAEGSQKEELIELRRKWNRLCHSLHQGKQTHQYMSSNSNSLSNKPSYFSRSYSYNSSSSRWSNHNTAIFPDSSSSISFADLALKDNQSAPNIHLKRQQSYTIDFNFGNYQSAAPSLDSLKRTESKEDKITLALGNSLFSDTGEKGSRVIIDRGHIGKILRENVPWQSEAIPSILEALIDPKSTKKETWLIIEGNDTIGKRRLAYAIAESLYGSAGLVLHLNMKKKDSEMIASCPEQVTSGLRNHEKLVILVEEVDMADTRFKKFLADGFETRFSEETSKRDGNTGQQAVFILTKGSSITSEDRNKNQVPVIPMALKINETSVSLMSPQFDLKRKAEWDMSTTQAKSPRIEVKEDNIASSGTSRRDFSRQSSFNTLDLNLKADEEDDDETGDKPGDISPISSDVTRETNSDIPSSQGFLESIKNRFTFNRNATRDREMKDFFLTKIKKCFEEVFGANTVKIFDVDEKVLEKVCIGGGFFLNSLFEKWLKDVFQTSLQTVKLGYKEGGGNGINIRLCLDSTTTSKGIEDDGFMGSLLPKKIQISSM